MLSMSAQWSPLLVFLALTLVMPVGILLVSWLVRARARRDSPAKFATYECGEEPDGGAWINFHPRYYLVALVFVLFDVEAMFLFPWAVDVRGLGLNALLAMVVFVTVLLTGWFYALRKGALKWP
jgi:NAD(P)H-quinone oxidoreductase subunit 3